MKNLELANVDCNREYTFWATGSDVTEKGELPCDSKGFTMVELIVVVAIIGILAAMAVPAYEAITKKAQVYRAIAEIRNLETEINAYFTEKGTIPPNLTALGRGNILDPWGRSYVYSPVPAYKDRFLNILNTTYDLYSLGIDGNSNLRTSDLTCKDDVLLAGDGSYIGAGESYDKF